MKAHSFLFMVVVSVAYSLIAGCTSTDVDEHPHLGGPSAETNDGNGASAATTDGILGGSGPSETSAPTRVPDSRGLAFQEAILSDGVVTFAEYERAVFAEVDCLERLGLVVRGPATWPDGPVLNISVGADPRLEYTFVYLGDLTAETDVAAQGCQYDWSWDVTLRWQEQNQPTERQAAQWFQSAIDCGLAHGVVFSNPPKEEEVVEVPLKFEDCRPWEAMGG